MEGPRRSMKKETGAGEFEFWMVGNEPEPLLLTADQLFVDGVILPLHLLYPPLPPVRPPPLLLPHPPTATEAPPPLPPAPPPSRRWKEALKATAAELNINIWPFSRSISAGIRPSPSPSPSRRSASSSAPCSRSNSGGSARRWAASPGRTGGVHLGRTNPVWRPKRDKQPAKDKKASSSGSGPAGSAARALTMNVQSCIGYRSQVSCRDDDAEEVAGGASIVCGAGDGNGSVFNLKTLFSSKRLSS